MSTSYDFDFIAEELEMQDDSKHLTSQKHKSGRGKVQVKVYF
jgi:hypothetical protein